MIGVQRGLSTGETDAPTKAWDAIIIGAGMAGLSTAALLASTGRRVLLLEAIHYPGGCASSYEKDGGTYDVGATTFSGVSPGQPLHSLFRIIGEFKDLLPADPPMGISMDGRMLLRHRDRGKWLREAGEFFGTDQGKFWDNLRHYSDLAYELMASIPYLPPNSPREYFADFGALKPGLLRHLPYLLGSVASSVRRFGLADERFMRFIDAQLLITSQATSERVPFLAGALGLTYPEYPVFSVRGGMLRYARFLEDRIHSFGGEIAYRQRVVSVTREGRSWSVRSKQGRTFTAPVVISSLPIFNLPAILEGEPERYVSHIVRRIESSGASLWGAFTLYALVPSNIAGGLPINLQVVLPRTLEHCGSSTLFCSFSHPDDTGRAPAGYRTLTISTHVHRQRPELRLSGDSARAWKDLAAAEIEAALRSSVPELAELSFARMQSGSPRTFEKYTGRVDGLVGGLPLDKAIFPFRFPTPKTPFDGLYLCGDTIFPGQGLPGVTLGALAVYNRILVADR